MSTSPVTVSCLSHLGITVSDLDASIEFDGQLANADEAGWSATQQALGAIAGSEDVAEGMRAFFERRSPVWRGR